MSPLAQHWVEQGLDLFPGRQSRFAQPRRDVRGARSITRWARSRSQDQESRRRMAQEAAVRRSEQDRDLRLVLRRLHDAEDAREGAHGLYAAGIAGAPVTKWELYDTHYTERYIGNPAIDAKPYADVGRDRRCAEDRRSAAAHPRHVGRQCRVRELAPMLTRQLQHADRPFDMMFYVGADPSHRAAKDARRTSGTTIERFLDEKVLGEGRLVARRVSRGSRRGRPGACRGARSNSRATAGRTPVRRTAGSSRAPAARRQ